MSQNTMQRIERQVKDIHINPINLKKDDQKRYPKEINEGEKKSDGGKKKPQEERNTGRAVDCLMSLYQAWSTEDYRSVEVCVLFHHDGCLDHHSVSSLDNRGQIMGPCLSPDRRMRGSRQKNERQDQNERFSLAETDE
ncbi:hypothetical protein AVEN_53212-1 [Araneus ventricosus]|uniref:Uncharacterized protein n=1 Tax=Araneus ventricosus TaxID=182803 RepID=A0A4Y2A9S7_ARAVE|nr:hypothetical protein AVEN_53212-1 [Araneus ventricosus]